MANNYKYNGYPIIQCGTFSSPGNSNGVNVTFPSAFRTNNVYIIANTIGYTNYFIVTPYIHNKSSTGFTANTTYKDGRNGQRGGGYWNGTNNYIAISEDYLYYTSILKPFILGSNITGEGTITYPSSGFSSSSSFICAIASANILQQNVAYCVYNESGTQCTLNSTLKDARTGEDGGGNWTGAGNYIAIESNFGTKFNYKGSPIVQCGEFTTNQTTTTGDGTYTNSGTANVTFPNPFPTGSSVFVCAIPNQDLGVFLASITIDNISINGFKAVSFQKNSNNGQTNGGALNALCNYIAVCIL